MLEFIEVVFMKIINGILMKYDDNDYKKIKDKTIVLPDGIYVINYKAFEKLKKKTISKIIMPKTLEFIDEYAFAGLEGLEEIIFNDGLKEIGNGAFQDCYSLKYIAFPEKLQIINNYTCINCYSLQKVTFSDNISEIGVMAFCGCSELLSLTIPSNITKIGYKAFGECSSLKSVEIKGPIHTGNEVFKNCKELEQIVFPKEVKFVASNILVGCHKLSNVTLPTDCSDFNVRFQGTSIVSNRKEVFAVRGSALFKYNGKDEKVIIPEGITHIMSYAFYNRKVIKEIVLPESITMILDEAFSQCPNLEKINFPSGLKFIGSRAFYSCSSMKRILLNEGLETIRYSAFEKCENLKWIVMPKSLKQFSKQAFFSRVKMNYYYVCDNTEILDDTPAISINEDVFAKTKDEDSGMTNEMLFDIKENCLVGVNKRLIEENNYQTITIPKEVKVINENVFYDCAMKKVELPLGLEEMKNRAFKGCNSLESIEIPVSVRKIENRVFRSCENLTTLILPSLLPEIDMFSFLSCPKLETIIIKGKKETRIDLNINIPEIKDGYSDTEEYRKYRMVNAVTVWMLVNMLREGQYDLPLEKELKERAAIAYYMACDDNAAKEFILENAHKCFN